MKGKLLFGVAVLLAVGLISCSSQQKKKETKEQSAQLVKDSEQLTFKMQPFDFHNG